MNAAMVEGAELCSPWIRNSPSSSTCSKGTRRWAFRLCLSRRPVQLGKVYPTPTGSPWPPTEAPCLSCTSTWNAWWDVSETTRSQERARGRVKDTPNGLTARPSPNYCLAKTAYRRSRRVSCSYGTFLEHPISARIGKWLSPSRGATSTRQKIGARGYDDLLLISRYELLRRLAG
jgi:hypothetical protein